MERDDALELPKELGWRTRGWELQILWSSMVEDQVAASLDLRRVARSAIGTLAVFMIAWPIQIFHQYLSAGILLVSPSLAIMFLAGFVGLGLSRSKNWGPDIPPDRW